MLRNIIVQILGQTNGHMNGGRCKLDARSDECKDAKMVIWVG